MAVPVPYDQKQKRPQSNVVPYPTTSQRVPTPQLTATQNTTRPTPTIPRSSVPTPPTSNYRSQLDNLLQQYQNIAQSPITYNPLSDPSYRTTRDAAARASRNAMEILNDRGILNSTITGSQIGQIQQEAEALADERAYERAYNQRQNQLANFANLASLYASRDDAMFNRGVTEAGLTGQYIPSQAQPLVQQLLALKQEAERPGLGAETYARYKEQGDAIRAQLRAMGVDTSWIDSNVTSAQALQQMPNVFATADERARQSQQQMQQQEMEYRAARDAIMDERWKQEFDEDARRFGLQYALNRQTQLGNLDISRYNAETSRMRAEAEQMDAERRSNEYTSSQDARAIQSEVMREMTQFDNPDDARAWINANAGYITQQLGADGLQQMYRMVDTLFGGSNQNVRDQAIRMAQNDSRWSFADSSTREELINEYMRLIAGGG